MDPEKETNNTGDTDCDSSESVNSVEPQRDDAEPVVISTELDSPQGTAYPTFSSCAGRIPGLKAWFVALLGWTILMCFTALDRGPLFSITDAWVAQTARQMQESGEWIVPKFGLETRLQKPPGAYWAVATISNVLGQPVDEVTSRMPNAIAAVVIVLMVFWLARHISGDRAAVYSGFAASSSVLILYWSHRAASDLGLAALITVSLTTLWLGTACTKPGWKQNLLWWVGYFSAGLGMLYKLPMPLVCIGLPAFIYILVHRRWSIFLRHYKAHLVGIVLFLLPWIPWVIAIAMQDSAVWMRWKVEFIDRFTGDLPNLQAQHQTRWYWYFYYLWVPFAFTIPYCLSLPAAVVRCFRKDNVSNRDGIGFLLIWFISLFLFFSIAAGKEARYLLPALPPLFVLLGHELSCLFDPTTTIPEKRVRLAVRAIWLLIPIGLIAGGYGVWEKCRHDGIVDWKVAMGPYVLFALFLGVGLCFSAWLFLKRKRNESFGAIVATMFIAWLCLWPEVLPHLQSGEPQKQFATKLAELVPESLRSEIRNVGTQNAQIVWYGDVRMDRVIDQNELIQMQEGKRDIQREQELIGEEMIKMLRRDETVLFVSGRPEFLMFILEAPVRLKELGEEIPRVYIWYETELGKQGADHHVLFSNRPPPDGVNRSLTPPSSRVEESIREHPEIGEMLGYSDSAVDDGASSPTTRPGASVHEEGSGAPS